MSLTYLNTEDNIEVACSSQARIQSITRYQIKQITRKGDWGEMKQRQVETVTITFVGDK